MQSPERFSYETLGVIDNCNCILVYWFYLCNFSFSISYAFSNQTIFFLLLLYECLFTDELCCCYCCLLGMLCTNLRSGTEGANIYIIVLTLELNMFSVQSKAMLPRVLARKRIIKVRSEIKYALHYQSTGILQVLVSEYICSVCLYKVYILIITRHLINAELMRNVRRT